MSSRPRSILACAVLVALSLAYAAWCLSAYRDFVHDDAFITLRYVANLLDGHGLVWNPGDRVEGYTSFVAVLAIAVPGLLGADLVLAARLVNGLALATLALYAGWFFAGRDRQPVFAALGAALIVTFPPFLMWTMGGLEAPFFAMAVAMACGAAAKMFRRAESRPDDWRVAVLLGALALVRPDGAVFGAVAGVFYVGRAIRADGPALSPIVRFAAAGLALPLLHLAFRLAYYGSVVPNSVIAKTVGQPPVDHLAGGLEYARGFLASAPIMIVGGLLALGVSLFRREARLSVVFLVSCAAIYAGFVVKAGGDHMPGHRLLLPIVPLLALALACLREAWGERRSYLVVGVVLAAQVLLSGVPHDQPADPAAFVGRIVGEHIDDTLPDDALIALNTAGSTAYFARGQRFIDMLGLNDAHIARREIDRINVPWQRMPGHSKGDGEYVLSREPDWIILGPAQGAPANEPWFLSDLEIVRDPRFRLDYVQRVFEIDARSHHGYASHRATRTGVLRLVAFERRDPVN